MDRKAKLLYVEDDEVLGFLTKDNLEENGYDVEWYMDGKQGLEAFEENGYDLCILDVMLPKMDGFELAKKIRDSDHEIPIIFLTAKSLKEDKIAGLKIGGDDYITKPFSIEELVLKIDVFLKRKYVIGASHSTMKIGLFTLDIDNLKLLLNGQETQMTQKEVDLLQLLIIHKNNTLRREEILKKLWGKNDYFLGRSMDVFISRLRKYLKADPKLKIENIHGVGFRLIEE